MAILAMSFQDMDIKSDSIFQPTAAVIIVFITGRPFITKWVDYNTVA